MGEFCLPRLAGLNPWDGSTSYTKGAAALGKTRPAREVTSPSKRSARVDFEPVYLVPSLTRVAERPDPADLDHPIFSRSPPMSVAI